jgi:hypothetical protein
MYNLNGSQKARQPDYSCWIFSLRRLQQSIRKISGPCDRFCFAQKWNYFVNWFPDNKVFITVVGQDIQIAGNAQAKV